jgi:hypothetical protein
MKVRRSGDFRECFNRARARNNRIEHKGLVQGRILCFRRCGRLPIGLDAPCQVKWTPLSRPFLALNNLSSAGSWSLCWGDRRSRRPVPFRRWNRRSGRIPAEPYPPSSTLSVNHPFWPKAINPRGSGTESPSQSMPPSLWFLLPPSSSVRSFRSSLLPVSGSSGFDGAARGCRT